MTKAREIGQAGLQGWRAKVADAAAAPIARRVPIEEDQVRALIGGLFFGLSVMYVVKTIRSAAG